MSSLDSKTQTLALLGSIEFSLEDLEKNVLNTTVTPQIFAAMAGDDAILAEEAAVCIKNLMTNEHLGSKCIRRLYALCILPLINQILERILDGINAVSSANFVEAIAVQIWCIASTVPAALPQITASPLAALVTKFLSTFDASNVNVLPAENALLQSFLVSVEDNETLAQKIIQINPQFLSVSFDSTANIKFDALHMNLLLRLTCFVQIVRCVPAASAALNLPVILNFLFSTLQTALPESSLFQSDPAGVKVFFEIYEMAAELLELLVVENSKAFQKLPSFDSFLELPFTLSTYFNTNFQRNFREEGNNDRIRLVRRIFSIIATLLTTQEQMIISGFVKTTRGPKFVQRMERVLSLASSSPSDDFNLCDEVSGWLRAWLTAWGESDYPEIPENFFSPFVASFYSSSSPVVLTNTCALTALLIPYAPEAIQKDFCVFLNNLLCTDPFDADHLEVLLAAVDGVTGIFDPQSKEWPAKSLNELKTDLKMAKERLCSAACVDLSMKEIVSDRIRSIDRIFKVI